MTVTAIRPNGDSTTQWTAVGGGGANYLEVDETTDPPDGNTTHVKTGTASKKDVYTMSTFTVPAGDLIVDVTVVWWSKIDIFGSGRIQGGLRISGVNYYDSLGPAQSVLYARYSKSFDRHPGTGALWVQADIDGMLATMNLQTINNPGAEQARITQVFVEITHRLKPKVIYYA